MRNTYEEFNIKTGQRIMCLRKQKAFTREYLAELADISAKFLYEIEMGKKGCSSYILYRLSRALDVPPDLLIRDQEDASEDSVKKIYGVLDCKHKTQVDTILKVLYEIFYDL